MQEKKAWICSVGLNLLSILLVFFSLDQLGLLSSTAGSASDTEKTDASEANEGEPVVSELGKLSKDLKEQEKKLRAREQALSEKEAMLGEREKKLEALVLRNEKTIAELEKMEKQAKSRQQKREIAAGAVGSEGNGAVSKPGEDIRAIYQGMEAKKAAKILEDLNVQDAVFILSGLSRAKSAEVLGLMSPVKARTLTEKVLSHRSLAGQKSLGQ